MPTAPVRRNLAGLVALLALGLAACGSDDGGDGVATAGGASTGGAASGPAPASDPAERQRQYTECLRQQGVELPDAEQGKEIRATGGNEAKVKEAARTCQRYAPSNAGTKTGDLAELRAYASCMRQNGVEDFPDPDPNRGLEIPKSVVNSPNFEAADRVCQAQAGKSGTSPTK